MLRHDSRKSCAGKPGAPPGTCLRTRSLSTVLLLILCLCLILTTDTESLNCPQSRHYLSFCSTHLATDGACPNWQRWIAHLRSACELCEIDCYSCPVARPCEVGTRLWVDPGHCLVLMSIDGIAACFWASGLLDVSSKIVEGSLTAVPKHGPSLQVGRGSPRV